MKKFKLVLVAMFAVAALMAQDVVYLYYNNGKVDEVAVSDFDSLSFTKPKPATTGEADRKEGEGTVKVKWVQLWENGPKWAEYNVGEDTGSESYRCGGYFAWKGNETRGIQETVDDTATALWGSNWQMPTKDELQALLDSCDVVWTDDYNKTGKAGMVFTGKDDYADNSVFFPAAGSYFSGDVHGARTHGNYWSPTPKDSKKAYYLYFTSTGTQSLKTIGRERGLSVRAVLKE